MPHRRPQLAAAFAAYAARWPEEAATAQDFLALADDAADPFVRERLAGHFTASAWVVDAAGERTLLLHHRKLGRWLQPGGHADGDPDLAAGALREAQEETGLRGLRVEPEMFDLDRHWIPARGHEPGHWHYDVRYVVRAGDDERCEANAESHALAWRDVASLRADPATEDSIRRMAAKWLARGGRGPAGQCRDTKACQP